MSLSVIRKATDEDFERVSKAAIRFCKRHDIERNDVMSALDSIEYWIEQESYPEDIANRRRLWAGCLGRALRVPARVNLTIAYGHVGLSV